MQRTNTYFVFKVYEPNGTGYSQRFETVEQAREFFWKWAVRPIKFWSTEATVLICNQWADEPHYREVLAVPVESN